MLKHLFNHGVRFKELGDRTEISATRRGQLDGDNEFRDMRDHLIDEIGELEEATIEATGFGKKDEISNFKFHQPDEDYVNDYKENYKDSEGGELADLILITCLYAKRRGIDLDKHVAAKCRFNDLRE